MLEFTSNGFLPLLWNHGPGSWSHGEHMMGFGGGLGMILMWLVFFVLCVLVIYALVRLVVGQETFSTGSTSEETAMDILEKRYARGEIDEEEYEQKKQNLTS